MKRTIITTADGSKTIQIESWNEQYHSIHGALQESRHVFIKHGLHHFLDLHSEAKELSILEIGFGTGLNTFVSLFESQAHKIHLNYFGVEAYPVSAEEISQLNYAELFQENNAKELFEKLHTCSWEKPHDLTPLFTLTKQQKLFENITDKEAYNLIYFDAFGARVQPELWTEAIFQSMYNALKPEGVLVTYSAKGSVRRAMQAVGFIVERLPGPPGKREMLRATK